MIGGAHVITGADKVHFATEPLDSGVERIDVDIANNALIEIPEGSGDLFAAGDSKNFDPPQTTAFTVLGIKQAQTQSAQVQLNVTDAAGNVTTCDPVITLLIREKGKPISETFFDIPQAESNITARNSDPGIKNLIITVNGEMFRMTDLKDNEERFIDVSSAMVEGDNNIIGLMAWGKPGSSATVVISD